MNYWWWELSEQIFGLFFLSVGKFAIKKDKDVCEICDLNYRSPSVNLMGFAIGRDEKYLLDSFIIINAYGRLSEK